MDLLIQISGVIYLLIQYYFSEVIFNFKEKHLNLLKISIILFFEILMLSIFKILNYQTLWFLALLKFTFILFKNSEIKKISFNYKFDFVNFSIFIVYLCYGYLSLISGFTIDDVLTTYIPRVNQWIQNQSVFINLDFNSYYTPILTYPLAGQFPLLIIKIFRLPDYFYFLISAYMTYQILLSIKKFLKLNEKEYRYTKFLLFLSPIILLLSSSGLTDLYFSYFLINSFYYISSFSKSNNTNYLFLSSVFAIFAINVRYHGLFVLFIVGLIILFSKRIENIYNFSKYTFFNFLILLAPNIIWQYNSGIFKLLSSNIETQLTLGGNNVVNINTELLERIDQGSVIFDFFNSLTYSFINFLFVDIPMLFLIRDVDHPYIWFMKRYGVFSRSAQVPTLGPIIFILSLFSIYFLLKNLSKNNVKNKNMIILTYVFILILISTANFLAALTIFVVGFAVYFLLKKIKYDLNLLEVEMNLNIILFILITYFVLISVRDYSSSNLRYLFPILLFIFPFGLKAVSIDTKSSLLKNSIFIVILISSIQPVFLNSLVTVNTPKLKFNNNKYEITARSWPSCDNQLIQNVYQNYDYLLEKYPSFNTLISTNRKFPISIFDKNNIYFSIIDTSKITSSQYFDKYNSNILIISEEFFNYDQSNIHMLDLNSYETIQLGLYDYYIINLFQLESCKPSDFIPNFTPNTTIPLFKVVIDGKNYFYTQFQIDDGSVERDTQRIENRNKWNCYMTNTQLERGDCKPYNLNSDKSPNDTIPFFEVIIYGKSYFYTQSEIDDGTVERDTQRIGNDMKWNCYMTDAQLERGDCETYNLNSDNSTNTTIP